MTYFGFNFFVVNSTIICTALNVTLYIFVSYNNFKQIEYLLEHDFTS